MLVFLTGQEEIDSVERLLVDRAAALPPSKAGLQLSVVSIYAAMPPEQQMKACRSLSLCKLQALPRHISIACCTAREADHHRTFCPTVFAGLANHSRECSLVASFRGAVP